MADIELVIKMPENTYNAVIGNEWIDSEYIYNIINSIQNGTPLQKGHGDLIDADEYQKKINSVFPCKDKDDANIRRATEMGLMSVSPIIEADKGE